jgi:hypothetical protein
MSDDETLEMLGRWFVLGWTTDEPVSRPVTNKHGLRTKMEALRWAAHKKLRNVTYHKRPKE